MNQNLFIPYKHNAIALLFTLFFGPIGLLYASIWGSITLTALSVMVVRLGIYQLLFLLWFCACIWSVSATEAYNYALYTNYNRN